MISNIKAAIFDMDGTLIDSMWVWCKIDKDYLANKNIDFPNDLRGNIEHLSFYDTAKYFKDRFCLEDSLEKIMDDWNNLAYGEYANNVDLKPGAKKLLSDLKNSGVKIALATSNCNLLLETVLRRHDIYKYFDTIVTTNEVERGKDCPDIYLLAAKKLGVEPKDCVVFEDILPAVLGAKSAGMMVIGVHDEYSVHQHIDIINSADKFILTFEDLNKAV